MPFLATVMGKLSTLLKNLKFKEAIGKKLNLPVKMDNAKFADKVTQWVNENPLKSQALLASSLSAIPSALPLIFGSDELPIVAQELQNVDFTTGNYSEGQISTLEGISGDRKTGYFGMDNDEVGKSTDIVVASLDKTSRIAHLFGLREDDVEEAVMLIQSYELADGQIYRKMNKR